MGLFTYDTTLTCPVERVFEFLTHPRNLELVSDPDLHLRVVEAPEVLALGSQITVELRRWGIKQQITSEVTTFEMNHLMVDEQRAGPFRRWVHRHVVESLPEGGTRMRDEIDFEAPGGLLALVMTKARIESELREAFTYREGRFKELLQQ